MKCYLNVISITQCLFSGYIKKIYISGCEGVLNIYPGHTPLLTIIHPGLLNIFTELEEKKLYVSDGILEIQPNIIQVLPDESCFLNDLNYDQLIRKKNSIEKKILQLPNQKKKYLEHKLYRIMIQLKLIQKYILSK